MTVSRRTPEGSVYLDLRRRARDEGRPFEELLSLHVLDGFLARLSESGFRQHLVLKGGVLLAAFDLRRPTRDVDLWAQDLDNDAEHMLDVVRAIARMPHSDGVVFGAERATATAIRDADEYAGVRVTMTAHVATAEVHFHVDVNVGDPVSPAPSRIHLPRVLGPHIEILGYPMAMVHAEKIVTATTRGTANTRWRDFGDIYALAGRHPIEGDELMTSLRSVAAYRSVSLTPLSSVLDGYPELAQTRYHAWRRVQGREDLPEEFSEVLDRVCAFADPALDGQVTSQNWSPKDLGWVSATGGIRTSR